MSIFIDILYYTANIAAGIIGVVKGSEMIKEVRVLPPKNVVFSRPIYKRKLSKYAWCFISIMVISLALSLIRDYLSEQNIHSQQKENKRYDSTQASINRDKIIQLERENSERIARILIQSKKETIVQIDSTAANVGRAVAEGFKVNDNEHKKTQRKVDSSKLAPAIINMADREIAVTKRVHGDSLFTSVVFKNDGQLTAYNINAVIYLLLRKEKKFYKTKVIFEEISNLNLAAKAPYKIERRVEKGHFNPSRNGYDEFYIVSGRFSHDKLGKNVEEFKFSYTWYADSSGGNFSISRENIDTLLKKVQSAQWLPNENY